MSFSDPMSGYSKKKLQILTIMAHPADTFDHCGGTMLHHVKKGDAVTVVGVLQGVRVHDKIVSDKYRFTGGGQKSDQARELREEREKEKNAEVVRACAMLGIDDVRFMGIEDKINLVSEELILSLARLIRSVKPDLLITHYPKINMGIGQHAQIGSTVVHAMQFAGQVDFDDPSPAHRTPQMFFTLPDNYNFKSTALDADTPCYCDLFVDVSDVIEEITRARHCMASQQYSGAYAKKSVECTFGLNGDHMHTGYAEPFIRYKPELTYYLPLPERMEKWSNEPEKQQLERRAYMVAPYLELQDET